jgi:2-C-methyl-D-erythritol 4-phosphate cytidylyltransferase
MRVKREDGTTEVTDRQRYLMVQTPQVFSTDLILDAYKQAYSPAFTDDATVVESMGAKIHLVQGKAVNIKLTRPEDMLLAKAILSVF